MSTHWLDHLRAMVTANGRAVRVSVVRADGSAPQGIGAAMTVGPDSFTGTVGGGALELEALREARRLLTGDRGTLDGRWHRVVRDFPLGPALGQCCGGYVQLMFEVLGRPELEDLPKSFDGGALLVRPVGPGDAWWFAADRRSDDDFWPLVVRRSVRDMLSGAQPRNATCLGDWYLEPLKRTAQPLFLYGAGHVGRALVGVLGDLPFDIYWVDTDAGRYPETVPEGVHKLVSADPAVAAGHAPRGAWHVVMTYSHTLDFDICQSVLEQGTYGYLGVIASKTKRARFVKRLVEAGIAMDRVLDLHAPIGLPGLDGKEPAAIAVSVAADFLLRLQEGRAERMRPQTNNARGAP